MNKKSKKLIISGLILIFFFSAIFCCCLTNVVEAKEPMPSCHQTDSQEDSSQETSNECDCNDELVFVKNRQVNVLNSIKILSIDQISFTSIYSPFLSLATSYQALPRFAVNSLNDIKHSILRI